MRRTTWPLPWRRSLRTCLARHRNGAIRRIIVIDENIGRRQRFAKIGNYGGDRGFLVEARHQHGNPHR